MSGPSVTMCSWCLHVQEFGADESGRAWLEVDVRDGAQEDAILSAEFCSPKCALDFLSDKGEMGTICFPEPHVRPPPESDPPDFSRCVSGCVRADAAHAVGGPYNFCILPGDNSDALYKGPRKGVAP